MGFFDSFIFGLIAWGLAAFAIRKTYQDSRYDNTKLVMGSFLLCCLSAAGEFFDVRHRAFASDFGGIQDTIGASITGILIMMIVTLVLNWIALKLRGEQDPA